MSGSNPTRLTGRCWVFPEANVNTDLMMPASILRLPRSEQASQVFVDYRPGWAAQVGQGDVIVAGGNFGTGSSRPAPSLMASLGVKAVIAESLNGLFFRNCINAGIAASECAGVLQIVEEGDLVTFDMIAGTVANERSGVLAQGSPLPNELIEIIADGGLMRRLSNGGFLKPRVRAE